MPQDAEREPTSGLLDRLDAPVLGMRGDAQALAEPAETLMVVRLHRLALPEQRPEPRTVLERHVVLRELSRRVLVPLVADDFRQVLDEIAAARDVEHLRPAADRQHR